MTEPTPHAVPTFSADALVTVIGGAGFIGRYIVQELARSGARIRVVSRNPDSALFLKPLGGLGQIQLIRGDVRSDTAMTKAFDGASAGINLVGILDEKGGQRFADIQARGAERAARAAAAAGVAAYAQMSAIGADAASAIPYARTKGQGEQAVLAALPGATILRPSIVAGPEDQFFNRFATMARLSPALPVICGATRFQPVFVRDVAEAAVAALARPDARGRTYELGGPDILTFRQILTMINRETGYDRSLWDVSDFSAGLLARMGDFLPFMPMTSDQLAMLRRDNVVGAGMPGLADLGVVPTPLDAFVPRMLQRYRKGGRFADSNIAA